MFTLSLSLWAQQIAVGQIAAVAESQPGSDSARLAEPVRPEAQPYTDSTMRAHEAGLKLDSGPQPIPPGFFHSPTGVLLRSVAFPGWGQWSNGKKKKAVAYFAVESFFITKALIWRHRAREANISFATFDQARDRRNYFYWLTGLTVFISMFDAYGDRYLLMLERTRDAEDEYWGGNKRASAFTAPAGVDDGWRLSLTYRF